MGFKCGIVGLPNVGKSTLFNALTNAEVAAENYPFCTIEPNVGIVPVPDPRLDTIAGIVSPQKVVPTTLEFVDIAGLVEGASRGEGLGNQFLGHIRETEAVAHIVRCFEDEDVVHVSGKIDPIADIEVINTELALADLDSASRALHRAEKETRSGDKDALLKATLLKRVLAALDQGKPVRLLELDDSERKIIRELHLITRKPVMYVANVSEDGLENNPLVTKVREYAEAEGAGVIQICGAIEAEIVQLDQADRMEFLQDLGLEEPGLNRMIRAGYELLDLQTFFTAGKKEVRAWTVQARATAPQAAGKIHTDFERGFIRAEVTAYEDFVSLGGEQAAKDAGKLRVEGKDYIVCEGDVMHFRFNV